MEGTFKTEQECVSCLIAEGFRFYIMNEGRKVYTTSSSIAEVYVYEDGSSSVLIGRKN